jgi:CHRD domain-containing protein
MIGRLSVAKASMLLTLVMASAFLVSQTKVYAQETTQPLVGKFTADLQPRAGSNATGNAILQVLGDLKTISYSIDASGLKDITNIAISQDTGTGRIPDVVIIRTPSAQGIMKGPITGTVAKGNFTASDLIGPLDGSRLADFVKAITDGKIVIRVSSSAFPLGEIAGKAIAGGSTDQTATGNMSAPANQTATGMGQNMSNMTGNASQ